MSVAHNIAQVDSVTTGVLDDVAGDFDRLGRAGKNDPVDGEWGSRLAVDHVVNYGEAAEWTRRREDPETNEFSANLTRHDTVNLAICNSQGTDGGDRDPSGFWRLESQSVEGDICTGRRDEKGSLAIYDQRRFPSLVEDANEVNTVSDRNNSLRR